MSLVASLHANIAIRNGAHLLDTTQVISSSYGNDSVALIQWVRERGFSDVHVVFVDTGWSKEGWLERVDTCEEWVRSCGFTVHRITPAVQFEELILSRGGFPNQRYQWCSGHLKGVPFLQWIDELDPECRSTVMIGKRREESQDRADTPEWVSGSEYHGGRTVRHPLYLHTEELRDILIRRAGFEPLPHRSDECSPCVNANKADLRRLSEREIVRVECLEFETGKTMFRPKKKMGAVGIRQVVKWANSAHGKYEPDAPLTCGSGYCGY